MLTPPANYWRISMKGFFRNAFLAYSLQPRVSDCKNTKISRHDKNKNSIHGKKNVSLHYITKLGKDGEHAQK